MFRSSSYGRRHGYGLVALLISIVLLAFTASRLEQATAGQSGLAAPRAIGDAQAGSSISPADSAVRARVGEAYGRLPLLFEANRGQTDARVKFLARGNSHTLFLTAGEAVLKLRQMGRAEPATAAHRNVGLATPRPVAQDAQATTLRLRFANANRAPRVHGMERAASKSHYLIGNDQRTWQTGVANFARVRYEAVYPGVDVVWYGNGRQLEYDLLIAPGARPERIKLDLLGAREMALDSVGALVVRVAGEQELRMLKPRAWQDVAGERREIACAYRLEKHQRVAFQLGAYDARHPLVIDPVLSYSTYLGGTGFDFANGVTVDGEGNAYVTGVTDTADFPGASQIQQSRGAQSDAFVVKLNPAGDALLWGTWLGGISQDTGAEVAVDAGGNVYVVGYTSSNNFPLQNALQPLRKGSSDAFVAKLNPTGSALLYATLLGGTGAEFGNALAVDAAGQVYVAGSTDSFDFLLQHPLQADKQGSALYISNDAGASWMGARLQATDKALSALNVNDVAIDPTNSQIIYAATDRGVYKSEDGGAVWAQVSGTQLTVNVTQVLVDPQQPLHIYAVSGSLVYKSIDAGRMWTRLPYPGFVRRLAIAGTTPVTLYGYDFQGFQRSVDGGATWTPFNVAPFQNGARGEAIVVDPLTPATVYVGTTVGLFKTTDGGTTWQRIGNGFPLRSSPNVGELVISRSHPQVLYGVQLVTGLFKSSDGGSNWQPAKLPPNVSPGFVLELMVDPVDPNTVYLSAQTGGLFKSSDGGETWRAVTGGLATSIVRALAIPKDAPRRLYAGGYVGSDGFVAKLNPTGSALVYATYLGGSGNDSVNGLTVDAAGVINLAGTTASADFPTARAYQANLAGAEDVFVAKMNAAGSALLWATFLGGAAADRTFGLASNAAGDLFITGHTFSQNFPTVRAIQTMNKASGGVTAFVASFGADGQQLNYATYLGGSGFDSANAIAVDAAGNAYVTGQTSSRDFPTVRAVQAKRGGRFASDVNAFVTVLNGAGTELVYSTYLGGNGSDFGAAIAVDARGSAYVVGLASSLNFPTTPNALRPAGGSDAFVTKLSFNADLAVALSDLPDPLQAGGNLTYLVTVTNNGPDLAEGVRLSFTPPAGTEVSRSTTQGDCAADVCNLGRLAVGGKATVTIVFRPNQTASESLRAMAATSTTTPDLNPGNNSAAQETRFATLPSIYGRVTTADGAGLSGATVMLSGTQRPSATTNADGVYQFAELPANADYTVTPTSAGYVFNPLSRALNNLQTDQRADFTAVACRFTIAPTTLTLPAAGGAATVTITSPDAQCAWTARSNVAWIKLNGAAADGTVGGRGSGMVSFTVAPTVGARSGTLDIGGNTLTLWQEFNACGQPEFVNPPIFQIDNLVADSGQPNMLVRDLNGDTIDDVLLLTRNGNQAGVSVMRGKAGGGFDAAVALLHQPESEGQRINAFDLKDVNADGKPDLIALYRTSSSRVLVAFGDGRGGFAAPVSYAAGQFPSDMVIADFNNDRQPDVILLGHITPRITIMLSDGAGGYGAAMPINGTDDSPESYGVGDFNQDGKADFALLDFPSLVILLGNGAGGFTRLPPVNTVSLGQSLVVGDFNDDGRSDVVMAGNGIHFLAGRGDGSFAQPVNSPHGFGNRITVVEDFSGDGRKDLIVPSSQRILYFTAAGDGRFNPPTIYHPGILTGGFQHTMAVGDYNRDGRPDLYFLGTATNLGPNGLVVMTTDNGGNFLAARSYPYQTNTDNFALHFPARSFITGDLNNDGLLDVVIARGRRRVEVVLGQGRGQFGAPAGYDVGENPQYPVIRDVNNDGKPDVLVMNRESKTISVLRGDGAGGFLVPLEVAVGDITLRDAPNSFAVGDFNTDGQLDLVAKGSDVGLTLLTGNGTGQFSEALTGIAADYANPQFVAGDFDGDGNLDLAVIAMGRADECFPLGKPPALLFGNGRGGFKPPITLELEGRLLRLFVADLNNDRRDDLLFTDTCVETNAGLKAMLARGDGGFAAPVLISERGGDSIRPFIGDVNGDGRPDILENASGGIFLPRAFLGRGDGTFSAPFNLPQSRDAGVAAVGDFDEDGSPDLLFDSGELIVTLNRGGCFAPGALVTTSAASYARFTVASEAIAALFGTGLAATTQVATTTPLPTTLANASVRLRDSAGVERTAPLFFVSPNQINLQIPAGLAPGAATVTVLNGVSAVATGVLNIAPLAPGLFTADASGRGLAAAVVLRVRANGSQSYEPVARLDANNKLVAAPIDLGSETERVFLLLFGSGLRRPGAPLQVKAKIGDADAEVVYAGAQGDLVGLDQINLLLPSSLRGRGEVEITLSVDGKAANAVKVSIK